MLRLHCRPDSYRDAFASFEKRSLRNFSNTDCGSTEPKEAPYAVTGENSKCSSSQFKLLLPTSFTAFTNDQ